EVTIDVEKAGAVRLLIDHVIIENSIVKRLGHSCPLAPQHPSHRIHVIPPRLTQENPVCGHRSGARRYHKKKPSRKGLGLSQDRIPKDALKASKGGYGLHQLSVTAAH